jgi:hypothetical protein
MKTCKDFVVIHVGLESKNSGVNHSKAAIVPQQNTKKNLRPMKHIRINFWAIFMTQILLQAQRRIIILFE